MDFINSISRWSFSAFTGAVWLLTADVLVGTPAAGASGDELMASLLLGESVMAGADWGWAIKRVDMTGGIVIFAYGL